MSELDVLDHIATSVLLGTRTRDDLLSLDPLPEWVHFAEPLKPKKSPSSAKDAAGPQCIRVELARILAHSRI
jgi:hypothetical protein